MVENDVVNLLIILVLLEIFNEDIGKRATGQIY